MVCSGPLVPRTGGALLLRVQDEGEIAGILEKDPFNIEKLAEYTVFKSDPNIGREGIDSLKP